MALSVWIDFERRLVGVRGSGTVTDHDVFLYQTTTWQRKDITGFDELVDLTGVEHVDVSASGRTEDLARLATSMDYFETPSRLAVVADRELTFQLANVYGRLREQMSGGQKRVAVFRSSGEAEQWLGLPAGAIAALFRRPPEPPAYAGPR